MFILRDLPMFNILIYLAARSLEYAMLKCEN